MVAIKIKKRQPQHADGAQFETMRQSNVCRQLLLALLSLVGLLGTQVVFATPNIQHWVTSNGARVYFVPAPDLPIIDVRVVFDAGSARDSEQPGLAVLTNQMITQGAAKLNATEIAQKLEGVGARLENGAERDMAWVAIRSLSEEKAFAETMKTMSLVLTQPSFPKADFNREKERLLVGLKKQKQAPDEIAEIAFYEAVFAGHPYASPVNGREESVRNLTGKDIQSFYKTYYVASNAVIAIVGDLSTKQAKKTAENLVATMSVGAKAKPLPEVKPLTEAKVIRISHPSTQSHVLMGQPGMSRDDPDYFALYVGNHTLGGSGLVSRVSHEVREKRGLSYSSYTYFFPMGGKGPFIMGLQTKNEQAEKAVQVLTDVVKQFIKDGLSADELEAAKKNITGGFPLRIDSNKKIVEYIAMIGFYGLPLDYLATFNDKVEALDLDTIHDAFRRRLNTDKMVTVIVGKQ